MQYLSFEYTATANHNSKNSFVTKFQTLSVLAIYLAAVGICDPPQSNTRRGEFSLNNVYRFEVLNSDVSLNLFDSG